MYEADIFLYPLDGELSQDTSCSFPYVAASFIDVVFFGEKNRRRAAFFIKQISTQMPKNLKFADTVQGTVKRTSTHETGKLLSKIKELQQQLSSITNDFDEEKNAKNKAYYYIISSGNFKRFAEFCKKHPANLDYHGACVAELFLMAITNEI